MWLYEYADEPWCALPEVSFRKPTPLSRPRIAIPLRAISYGKWETGLYSTAAKWHIHTEFQLEPNEAAVRNSASTNDPHAFIENQTKHAILAHEQSFPYVQNDVSQKVPFRTQHISPETAVATEKHRKIYFIILLKPQNRQLCELNMLMKKLRITELIAPRT